MHLCMKRSSPHASMPVSFSFPFQFKAWVQSSKFAVAVVFDSESLFSSTVTALDLLSF